MNQEFLFVEKYRPQTIEDTILPAGIKSTFQEFVKQGEIPNLMLCGLSLIHISEPTRPY
mgnify:CR=1 FL=1